MTRRLVCVQRMSDTRLERIRETAPGWEVVQSREPDVWRPLVRGAEVVLGWHPDVARLCLEEEGAALRWVHVWGAGVDRLPLPLFRDRGVWLTNSSGVHAFPISETVLAMMLAFTRKLHTYARQQAEQTWHHAHLSQEMHGKTVGILGAGAIGEEIARLAKAFQMQTLGLRRSGQPAPHVDRMFGPGELSALLPECDYVVNALPLTPGTRRIIGAREFSLMKPSAFYVNIGRGGTNDEAALIAALREKTIAGAGLDVFEEEPLPKDSPFWRLDNVILTPHSAGSTEHYDDRALDYFLDNLRDYVRGNPPAVNRVDLEAQY